MYKDQLFYRYFSQWVEIYKAGAVAQITLNKYLMTAKHLEYLAPHLTIANLNRLVYQSILNRFAETHERLTVMDFHHQLRSSILDALEEGIIRRDPTRKAVIKGKKPTKKITKFLNQFELRQLLHSLCCDSQHPYDFLILLIAKTGLRFSEALGLTAADIDFSHQLITINKTWDYKSPQGGYAPTKNKSSKRKVRIDWQLAMQLRQYIAALGVDGASTEPIFIRSRRVFNATVNHRLKEICLSVGIPVITLHALRHTHASLLLYAGVSVASVAKRLGHANMATTQSTYIHIIRELEAKDNDKVIQFLSEL